MKKRMFPVLLVCLAMIIIGSFANPRYSIGVRVIGSGKPMILIPGLKGGADTYNDVVAHYKARYKCYVITLAGFAGQPPSGVHHHLLQKQRDDIIQYIIDHHLQRPVIVGFSFGGTLATWVAVTRPDIVGPLVDIDGTPFDASLQDDHLNKDSLIKSDRAKYAEVVDEPAEYWRKRDSVFHSPAAMKQSDVRVWRMLSDTARFNELTKWDIASDFRSATLMRIEADTVDMLQSVARLRRPVLVLGSWVSRGYESKLEAATAYAGRWKNAKQVTIVFSERGKHFLMYEDLPWMLAQMDAFLKPGRRKLK